MYFLLFFVLERLLGIYYVFEIIGGKITHLYKRCECCEKKISSFLKICLSFTFFLEWKLFDLKIINKICKNLSEEEYQINKKNFISNHFKIICISERIPTL
jgi:hypothetical protein